MIRYKLESLAEAAAVNDLPFVCQANAKNGYYTPSRWAGDYWFCSDRSARSTADVQRLLTEPLFPQGVARIESLAEKITAPTPRSRRRKPRRGAQGDDLDMQRVWQGDLEHAWTEVKREQTVGPARVLIAVNVAGSACVDAAEFACRGAAALALASALQTAGFTVSIVAVAQTTLLDGRNTKICGQATVLAPGQEIDIHKLANLLASALLWRGVFLNCELKYAEHRLEDGISYGHRFDLREIDTTGFDHVATISENEGSVEAGSEWLKNEMAKIEGNQNG